jgi:8-oxo-dGTP diphosphatase
MRDPRAPWAMSIIYRSLVQPDLETIPGKRIESLAWSSVEDIAQRKDLAFDHSQLITQAVESTRGEVAAMHFPEGWLTEPFTLGELQFLSEAVLGTSLDKVTFRRRIDAGDIAQPLAGQLRTGGAHRPAQLYRLTD